MCYGVIHELTKELFMALLHVRSKTEARVENFLANVTLEVGVKLSMEFMLVLDAAVHVAEGLIALVACQGCWHVMDRVVVGDCLKSNN